MVIEKDTYEKILRYIKKAPPEMGGVLGMKDEVVTEFEFDRGVGNNPRVYEPDIKRLNYIINRWKEVGVDFCGIVHSHLPCQRALSGGDEEYIAKILDAMPWPRLYFPLVVAGSIVAYVAEKTATGVKIVEELVVLKKERFC